MTNGEVYLIHSRGSNLYKIGKSKDPIKRKKPLQTGHPYIMSVIKTFETKYPFKLETSLHNFYDNFKRDENNKELEGEWFQLNQFQVDEFLEICKRFNKNIELLKELDNPFI